MRGVSDANLAADGLAEHCSVPGPGPPQDSRGRQTTSRGSRQPGRRRSWLSSSASGLRARRPFGSGVSAATGPLSRLRGGRRREHEPRLDRRGERGKFTALPDVVNGRPGLAGVRRAAHQIALITRAQGPPSAVSRGAGGQTKERSRRATIMWFRSWSEVEQDATACM